jgi:hypothetical protein
MDAAKPVAIRIPDNLLLDKADAVFAGNSFRVAADSKMGARERAFLENYENVFSWGGGGRVEVERIFAQAQDLAPELRQKLRDNFRCGAWFEDDISEHLIQEQFLGSRCITYKSRTVVMPIIELANHGHGTGYDTDNGVALKGTFPGEVLVRYSSADSYGLFLNWGFAADQPQAMSMAMSGSVGQTALNIDRDLSDLQPNERAWMPKMIRGTDGLELPFLVIGNKPYPRLCKGVFFKLMRDASVSGFEETFDTIQHLNRMHFLDLLAALEGVGGPMAQTLQRMARFQLQAMSSCYGVRAV